MREQIMSETTGSGPGAVLLALVVGVALGAGAALLYAPQSGKKARRKLAETGRRFQGKADGALENGKGFVRDKKSVLAAAVEGGKEAMREERAAQAVSA
jgi:gas vesicle protein